MQAITVAGRLDWVGWFRGVIGAMVSGGSAAVTAAFTVNVIDPKDWGIHGGGSHLLELIFMCFAISGVMSLFKFLQTHPTPDAIAGDAQK